MTTIGVFDSGIGGESVAQAVRQALPDAVVYVKQDRKNLPYGTKSPDELFSLTLPILNKLSKKGCDVIVIACNTVTTTIIERLRAALPIPLIGIEPMVAPAAKLTKTGVITICATPATLASERYEWLKQTYAPNLRVIEPDCHKWAAMIEDHSPDRQIIHRQIARACRQGSDVIVLGCTHYHWIESEVREVAEKYDAKVLQPEKAVVTQLKRVLARLD